ncbi:hypothetical protein M885DRAFT_522768 [Pelagophyceae sp. CCMP2097]|nr:hypothetical protein M885DRAFT_522768 [Pelagophyceae sp. CCMP2097]
MARPAAEGGLSAMPKLVDVAWRVDGADVRVNLEVQDPPTKVGEEPAVRTEKFAMSPGASLIMRAACSALPRAALCCVAPSSHRPSNPTDSCPTRAAVLDAMLEGFSKIREQLAGV